MSMEIGSINNINRENLTFRTERENLPETEKIPAQTPQDEYISREKADNTPTGLYRLGQDENGSPRVLFDDPSKAKNADKENKTEKCTSDTDKVDREIQKLKEEKEQLEQQLKAALGNDKKTAELNRKMEAVEKELSRKDNDTYRRQHAVIS
ncbi:MAG: hypothetical protein NC086_07595 [Alistipes sp.]|nr:hypothetical protein [Alistipes sp.]